MGYPYDKTYLQQIQEKPSECQKIKNAYYAYINKLCEESPEYSDIIDIDIKTLFKILGEAFQYNSDVVGSITDAYHFMWDVLDALLKTEYSSD